MSNCDYYLKRMARIISPERAIDKSVPSSSKKKYCHEYTAKGIVSHPDPNNKIWFFGLGLDVMHSILTDSQNRVLVDNYPGVRQGVLRGDKYFIDSKQEYLDTLCVLTVGEFYKRYFEPTAATRLIKVK